MEKQIVTVPRCFEEFKCIADKCTDSCCIGWEIGVDETTYEKYKNCKDGLWSEILESIEGEEDKRFRLGAGERCPFLNEDNLCRIILGLGEENIPEICREHPRFYEFFEDRIEMGVGLCCEEGARLLFLSPERLDASVPYESTDIMAYGREVALSIIQRREIPFFERLQLFLEFSESFDERLMAEDEEGMISVAERFEAPDIRAEECPEEEPWGFKMLFEGLEPINDDWIFYSRGLLDRFDQIIEKRDGFYRFYEGRMFEYEHFAVYLIMRYYLKDLTDLKTPSNFILLCVLMLLMMDINSYLTANRVDRVENAKLFSKEVEYSEENVEFITDLSYGEFENIRAVVEFFKF